VLHEIVTAFAAMINFTLTSLKLVTSLVVMLILCTIGWSLLASGLYDCSDENMFGFLRPGDWVHEWNGHPVVVVQQIIHGRSMSEPDTIKQGWSVTGLWCLWYSFVGASVVLSLLLAGKPWIQKPSVHPTRETATPVKA